MTILRRPNEPTSIISLPAAASTMLHFIAATEIASATVPLPPPVTLTTTLTPSPPV